MNTGLLFCFIGMLAFGLLGSVSKQAERNKCNASALVVLVFAWATLAMLAQTMGSGAGFALPAKAVAVAAACGCSAAAAYFAFQTSIRIGKLAAGWLMMNLSSAVPALVSVALYDERLTGLKIGALSLVVASLLFLFAGHRRDAVAAGETTPGSRGWLWVALMLTILLTNGMSSFGLKVITAWGLPEAAKFPYLTVWYAAGMLLIGVPAWFKGARPKARETGWGAALAALSIAGQVAMAVALAQGIPGHIVFPVAIGGSVLVVTLAGRFYFGESMNRMTAAGTAAGVVAVVLLSVS